MSKWIVFHHNGRRFEWSPASRKLVNHYGLTVSENVRNLQSARAIVEGRYK